MARVGTFDRDWLLFDPTLDIKGWFDPDLIDSNPVLSVEIPPTPAPSHEWIRGLPNTPIRGQMNEPIRGLQHGPVRGTGWRQIR